MNKKIIVMAAFAAMFGMSFTACSNNDDVQTGGTPEMSAKDAISFSSFMDGMPQTRAYNASLTDIQTDGMSVWAFDATKETAINNEGGQYFMGGYSAGLAHTWQSSFYKAAADYFWPEYNLNFVALTPQSGGGIGAITCSQAAADLTDPESPVLAKPVMTVFVDVPLTTESAGTYGSDTQKDIMIASIEGQAPLTSGSAALTFKHALSQLVFKGVIDHETTIHKAVVKSIKLVNVASDGTITYTAATDAFSAAINDGIGAAGQTKEYAANIVNNTVTKLDNNTEGPESSVLADYISGQADNADGRNYQLMILPQTSVACTGVTNAVNVSQKTAPTAGTYFLVNADLYANNNNVDKVISSTTNVYIPLAETTWAPGTKYTYTFKFGDNLMHPITFTAAISDWTDAAKNVEY